VNHKYNEVLESEGRRMGLRGRLFQKKHGLPGREQCEFSSQAKVNPIPIVGHRFSSGFAETKVIEN
jgi:hypothetical protein